MLALVLLLQACSAMKLVYNSAPDVMYWWLDAYVDFDEAQSLRLRGDLAQYQQWHRRNELPRYADALQRAVQRMPGPLTAEQVCAFAEETRANIDRLAVQAEPAAAELALTMKPAQFEQMARKYARTNADYRKLWLEGTPQERAKKRFDKMLDDVEVVYGALAEPQHAVLREQLALSPVDAQASYAERLRRQQDLMDTLRRIATDKPTLPVARELLRGVAQRALRTGPPAYRAYADAQLRAGCAGFAALHNSTTPAQRERAVQRLQGYERDFRALAAQP